MAHIAGRTDDAICLDDGQSLTNPHRTLELLLHPYIDELCRSNDSLPERPRYITDTKKLKSTVHQAISSRLLKVLLQPDMFEQWRARVGSDWVKEDNLIEALSTTIAALHHSIDALAEVLGIETSKVHGLIEGTYSATYKTVSRQESEWNVFQSLWSQYWDFGKNTVKAGTPVANIDLVDDQTDISLDTTHPEHTRGDKHDLTAAAPAVHANIRCTGRCGHPECQQPTQKPSPRTPRTPVTYTRWASKEYRLLRNDDPVRRALFDEVKKARQNCTKGQHSERRKAKDTVMKAVQLLQSLEPKGYGFNVQVADGLAFEKGVSSFHIAASSKAGQDHVDRLDELSVGFEPWERSVQAYYAVSAISDRPAILQHLYNLNRSWSKDDSVVREASDPDDLNDTNEPTAAANTVDEPSLISSMKRRDNRRKSVAQKLRSLINEAAALHPNGRSYVRKLASRHELDKKLAVMKLALYVRRRAGSHIRREDILDLNDYCRRNEMHLAAAEQAFLAGDIVVGREPPQLEGLWEGPGTI